MTRQQHRVFALFLGVAVVGALSVGLVLAANPNERVVEPQQNVQDPGKINEPGGKLWVLDFKFKDPRLIKVDVPGRGQKVCWYLWYQVINKTGEPRTFIPDLVPVRIVGVTMEPLRSLPAIIPTRPRSPR